MLQESLHLTEIGQEAVSRLSSYELVERAVAMRAGIHDTLEVGPIELEDGGTLYTVTSGIVASRGLRVRTVLKNDELVRHQTLSEPLTVFADVVELHPPDGLDAGEARLYRVEESLTPSLAETHVPFREVATDIMAKTNPTYGKLPICFDNKSGIRTFYYEVPEFEKPDRVYLSAGSDSKKHISLLAEEQTRIHLQEIGKNELDHEVGVLATVSGLVRIALDKRQFVYVASNGVFYGPSEEQAVKVDMPQGMVQHHSLEFYRIPDGAFVKPNEQGELIIQGGRANDKRYKNTKLNPDITPAQALELIPDEAIDWTDGTATFMSNMDFRIAELMPLDGRASYVQTIRLARDKIREGLLTHREPVIGGIGCAAVSARLPELPATFKDALRVDEKFFDTDTYYS